MPSFVSQFSVRNEVMATSHVTDEWMTQMEMSSLNTYIVRRYIATPNGVLRIYPGSLMDKAFDPTRRQWWVPGASVVSSTPPSWRDMISTHNKATSDKHIEEDTLVGVKLSLNGFLNIALTTSCLLFACNVSMSSVKSWGLKCSALGHFNTSHLFNSYLVHSMWSLVDKLHFTVYIMASNYRSWITCGKGTHTNSETFFYFWALFLLCFSKIKNSQVRQQRATWAQNRISYLALGSNCVIHDTAHRVACVHP